ncbi:Hypothetical_protein [Hexamita inflata]|uniref:Hypothetical_protein n=1 Tax=Hexamita inflata TaxID=28002 RepID=A0ABP1H8I3_9EUKA
MSVLMRRENTLIIEPGSDISKIQIINFILLPNSKKHFEGPPLYKSNLQEEQEKIQSNNKQVTIVDSNNSQKIVSFKNGIIVETIYSQVQQILVTPTYIYVGQTVNGVMSGTGTLVFNDGTLYNGKFVQNRFSGSGTLQITSGTTMSGMFKDGDFITGELQKSNSKNIVNVYDGNWKVYFPNLKIGSKKLQDFYEQKQDKTQKIQVVDSTKPITEVVFYNAVLQQALVISPRNQILSNSTSQQLRVSQDSQIQDYNTTPQSAKLQIGLSNDYSKVPTTFYDQTQKSEFPNQLENEIKQLKQQNEKQTEELNKFKNEVKTTQNELIQTKMQNQKIVQEKEKIISQLQQQIQSSDNELEVKISQRTIKFQSEIQELKKTNQQLINNQINLFNNEQLETEVQNRIQAETRSIYEKIENIIKIKYQKALDNEIQKYIQINDDLSNKLETQKQGYEEQIKDIKLQLRIVEQEKRDQKQISDQKYEQIQKQFNDFMSLNSNQNQLKQLQTEKENQEQFYRSNTLELQQQLQSQKQNFEKQISDLANNNIKCKQDYTTVQRIYELQTQIAFDLEAKLKISENNFKQATQSLEDYKSKYNQQTFNDTVKIKLETQRQQFVPQLNTINKQNEKCQELEQKNSELEKQIVQLNSELKEKITSEQKLNEKLKTYEQNLLFSEEHSKCEQVKQQLSDCLVNNTKLYEENDQLQSQIKVLQSKYENIEKQPEYCELKGKYEALKKEFEECKNKYKKLEEEHQKCERLCSEKVKAENEAFQGQINALKTQNEKLQRQIGDQTQKQDLETNALNNQMNMKQAAQFTQQQEFEELKVNYKKLENEHSNCKLIELIENKQKSANEKQTEDDQQKLELKTVKEEFEKQKQNLQNENEKLNEKIKTEEKKFVKLQQLFDELALEHSKCEQNKLDLKQLTEQNQIQVLSEKNKIIQELQRKYTRLEGQLKEEQNSLKKVQQQEVDLKQKLQDCQTYSQDLLSQNTGLTDANNKSQQEVAKLQKYIQSQVKQLESKEAQMKELNSTIKDLNEKIAKETTQLQKEIDKLSTEKQEIIDNLTKYKQQIVDETNAIIKKETEKLTLQQKDYEQKLLDKANARIQQNIEIQTKQHKEAIDAEQTKYKQLEQQLLNSQNKQPLQDVTQQQQEQQYMIEDLQRQLNEVSTKYSQLHKANSSNGALKYYIDEANEYQRELSLAQDEIRQLKHNAQQLDKQSQGSQLTRIQQKYDQLQKDKEKLQKEFDDKTAEIQKLKDQEKEFCTLMQQNNEKQNDQNVKLKNLITNLLNEQKETEAKVKEMVKVFNDEKKTLLEKHELEMKNPDQYKINLDKAELEQHKVGITEQLSNQFNQQLAAQQQQFESSIQQLSQQNQNTMQQYQQQLQVYQQQLQSCQIENKNVQVRAEQYSVTIQNEAKQWIDNETARITTELNNQQQILKDEKQSLELQITQLQSIVDKIPQIVAVNNIVIDLKEFPEDTGQKLVKKLEKQLPKMISAHVAEDKNIIVMVKQEDAEETTKIIRKLKIDDKRLSCQILDQNSQVLESVINISVSESEAQVKEGQILIDLKEFPEDTAPKLIKTLKKQIPEMITADVMEDLNVLITVKQEDVEETARTIRRLKILEKRLNCTIVNKNDKKDEKKKANMK